MKTTNLIVEIPVELHEKLKIKAIRNQTSLKDLVTPALESIVK